MMDIGDLVKYDYPGVGQAWARKIGTVIDFPSVNHEKEFQKVKVVVDGTTELWIMQFCKVVSEMPKSS